MKLFHFILPVFVYWYRLTQGRFGGHVQRLRVLLLTTVGRKTGQTRTTPLGYFMDHGSYIIIASNAGFDTNPAWFYNLRANPRVMIEVRDQQTEAEAEIAEPKKRSTLWGHLISLAPGYANYTKKTAREIPMVVLRSITNA
jgi:deazaflavin-dependent oxidoreductase (nitroreductase family)